MRVIRLVLLLVLMPSFAMAAFSSATGTLADGELMTFNGSDFTTNGPPNIVFYSDFNDGTPGEEFIRTDPDIGECKPYTADLEPLYGADGVGGGTAMQAISTVSWRMTQCNIEFDAVTEVFVSYYAQVPDGRYFPTTDAEETFQDPSSAWKVGWIMDGEDGHTNRDDDVVIPTSPDGTWWKYGGNDGAFSWSIMHMTASDTWFDWDVWNRISNHMKAGENPTVDTGLLWLQGLSTNGQNTFSDNTKVLFDGDDEPGDDDISQWTYFRIPGWVGDLPINGALGHITVNQMVRHDDLYIATGDNSPARVEIGDNAVYANCTKLSIATVTSWSPTSISATIRAGEFKDDDTVYFHIIDGTNTVVASSGAYNFGDTFGGSDGAMGMDGSSIMELTGGSGAIVWQP